MNQDLSIFTLVLHASFVVQLVIAILLLMSLASWSVIFGKLFGLKRVRGSNDDFEREFWSGKNLNDLHQSASTKADTAPMERIFAAGMREFLKLRERRVSDAGSLLDHTLVVWTNELGKGNSHTLDNIPFVLVGGGFGFQMGRSLKFEKVPHNRLHLALAHAMGHRLETFGKPSLCEGGPLSLV